MCEEINTEAEFRELAARLKWKYGKIQIRVDENLLVNKFFVYLFRWCKDFPGGAWDRYGCFVTKSREVALSLMELEGKQPSSFNKGVSR
jgi:hypothetical protein